MTVSLGNVSGIIRPMNDHESEHMTNHDRQATAFHEAGHAVVALALGRSLQKVSIAPNELRLGLCKVAPGTSRPRQDFLEGEMQLLFAGIAAEAQFTGQYNVEGARQDLNMIRRIALQKVSAPKQIERLERKMLDKAEYLLSRPGHREAVSRIAAELLTHTTISGRAARYLFERSLKEFAER